MWLDRFERTVNGKLTVVGIRKSGSETHLSPGQMQTSRLDSGVQHAISLTTSFSQWRRVSARNYLAAFDITSDVSELHAVFSVPHQNGDIIVPAWELQRTLLSAPAAVAEYVYCSTGLEQLCSPVCAPEPFDIAWIADLGRRKYNEALIERLRWFYAYPSAYRAWNSIYRHACAGRIDIDLPDADIEMSAHGRIVDGVFYAHRIYVYQVSPLESPADWAMTDRKSYDFIDASIRHRKSRQTEDARLRPVGGCWTLSDEEWAVVEALIEREPNPQGRGRPKKYKDRQIIDGIIDKLGTGKSWVELAEYRAKYHACKRAYNLMVSDGRWKQVVEFLDSVRPQV